MGKGCDWLLLVHSTPNDACLGGEGAKAGQGHGEGGERHLAYGLADGGQVVALAYEGEGHVEVAVRAVVALDALGSQGVLKTKESGLNLVAELYGYEYSGHIDYRVQFLLQ